MMMEAPQFVSELDVNAIPTNSSSRFWLQLTEDGFSKAYTVPVIVLKGKPNMPVIGLTAALHGNELNGIPVIQELVNNIDIQKLNGTIIAVPGINAVSIPNHKRRFVDQKDLNRNFPGNPKGNRSEQYVWSINQKILKKINYLVDMHTASFGRVNSLYTRADMSNEIIATMANAIDADIILHNKGKNPIFKTHTMRAEAMKQGIPTVTLEYGNPQVYQPKMISRGVNGLLNLLNTLNIYENNDFISFEKPVLCRKSYWVYTDKGGYLDVKVDLTQIVNKGDLLAILKNPFGDIIKEYVAPEKGIIIGKSTNPVNMTGGRIVHLGIIKKQ